MRCYLLWAFDFFTQFSFSILIYLLLQFEDLGIVSSIEVNNKSIPTARKGMEVCIKIEPIPGETPKLYGRHFTAEDMLMSKVSLGFLAKKWNFCVIVE